MVLVVQREALPPAQPSTWASWLPAEQTGARQQAELPVSLLVEGSTPFTVSTSVV